MPGTRESRPRPTGRSRRSTSSRMPLTAYRAGMTSRTTSTAIRPACAHPGRPLPAPVFPHGRGGRASSRTSPRPWRVGDDRPGRVASGIPNRRQLVTSEAVAPIAWMHRLRDDPAATRDRLLVLFSLATRLNAKGVGRCSVQQLLADCGVGEKTARRALDWAQSVGYLERTRRGHRLGNGGAIASEWRLSQPVTTARLSESQLVTTDALTTSQPVTTDGLSEP